jgi:DNA polymerase-3 subunit gamma/tau
MNPVTTITSFAQIVGQDPVVEALENALNRQHLHYAYLFTGPPGVGKKTMARVFGKAIESSDSRYTVHIIEEAHTLTTEAFNTLQTALEDPTPHVVFLLTSTEPHRIPAAMVARCLAFDLKPWRKDEDTP